MLLISRGNIDIIYQVIIDLGIRKIHILSLLLVSKNFFMPMALIDLWSEYLLIWVLFDIAEVCLITMVYSLIHLLALNQC
jgi:hypothetical protein